MRPTSAFDAFAPKIFSAYCTFSSRIYLTPYVIVKTSPKLIPYYLSLVNQFQGFSSEN